MNEAKTFGSFNLKQIAATFPPTSDSILLDVYLTDEPSASTRLFRAYRTTPPHYHANSDEHLYVLSGSGTFWMDAPSNSIDFSPGTMVFFKRGTVHAMPEIHTEPIVFLAIDTPRRNPKDIIFINPEDGTPESFIRPILSAPW